MNGFINKEYLIKYLNIQKSIVIESKEYVAVALTENSRETRIETYKIQCEMLELILDLLQNFSRLEALLSELNLRVKSFYPDASVRKVKCVDLGGNERIFNYRFTDETLEINSEFGRNIVSRNLWSDTFKNIGKDDDFNE